MRFVVIKSIFFSYLCHCLEFLSLYIFHVLKSLIINCREIIVDTSMWHFFEVVVFQCSVLLIWRFQELKIWIEIQVHFLILMVWRWTFLWTLILTWNVGYDLSLFGFSFFLTLLGAVSNLFFKLTASLNNQRRS